MVRRLRVGVVPGVQLGAAWSAGPRLELVSIEGRIPAALGDRRLDLLVCPAESTRAWSSANASLFSLGYRDFDGVVEVRAPGVRIEFDQPQPRSPDRVEHLLAAVLSLLSATTLRAVARVLTAREFEALVLYDQGLGLKQVAARMGISLNTLRGYQNAVRLKLNLHSFRQAPLEARRRGILVDFPRSPSGDEDTQ